MSQQAFEGSSCRLQVEEVCCKSVEVAETKAKTAEMMR